MICSISPKFFTHPLVSIDDRATEYSEYNRLMIAKVKEVWGSDCFVECRESGKLDLKRLARHQLVKEGLKDYNIGADTIDTYGDQDTNGDPIWWSHRRGDTERNGIVVIKHY